MEIYSNLRQGEKGAWLSIVSYLFLSVLKLVVGYIGFSTALIADGLNNTTDIISSVAVLIGLRIAQLPPDANHHYGHLRAETIASLVASFIMMVVGLQVLNSSVRHLWEPAHETPTLLTAVIALFSALFMYAVYRYNLALARKTQSSAVRAAAFDNRSDALISLGAGVGILAAIYGYPIIDLLTALFVGLIIVKTALEIFWEAVQTLMDAYSLEKTLLLKKLIVSVEGVVHIEDFRARTHGNRHFIDVVITINPYLDIRQGHTIVERIEHTVQCFNPNYVVFVKLLPNKNS